MVHSSIHVELSAQYQYSGIHVEQYRYETAHCLYTVDIKKIALNMII